MLAKKWKNDTMEHTMEWNFRKNLISRKKNFHAEDFQLKIAIYIFFFSGYIFSG